MRSVYVVFFVNRMLVSIFVYFTPIRSVGGNIEHCLSGFDSGPNTVSSGSSLNESRSGQPSLWETKTTVTSSSPFGPEDKGLPKLPHKEVKR